MRAVQWTALGVLALSFVLWAAPAFAQRDASAGKAIYEARCEHCHGAEGKGDGPAAERVLPRPRDFTQGWFKLRSTPSGALPTDADLIRTVVNGIPGTSMPGFGDVLNESQRRDVVTHIKTFTKLFEEEEILPAVKLTQEVPVSEESLARGKQLFADIECNSCHGTSGRANGESAPTLKDEWKLPIRPANLTKPWTFRNGSSPQDLFRTLMTGLTGSPMPSFADVFEVEEDEEDEEDEDAEEDEPPPNIWDLINYVSSLGRQRPTGFLLVAKQIDGELPTDYDDAAWERAPQAEFALVGQVIAEPRWFTPMVDSVWIKALYNQNDIAFRLDWDDPTPSKKGGEGPGLPDAFVMQFPTQAPTGPQRPYFFDGDSKNSVYQWKYTSDPQGIVEQNASGRANVKLQDKASQTASGSVAYNDGQYRMVIKRSLVTDDAENEIQFAPGKFFPITFSAWDGGNGEEGAKRSLGSWNLMFIEPPESSAKISYPIAAIIITFLLEMLIIRAVRRKTHREQARARDQRGA